jgi:hypothetical protein
MATVVKEWKCDAHGYFESVDPVCPHGCTAIQRVFLTPVAFKSDKTKRNDTTLQNLATDFQMNDIKSVREGEAQPPRLANDRNPFAVQWGSPNQISSFNTNSIRGENVNGLSSFKQYQPTGPKAGSYIPDHEGLKISK